jgi:hypothetical protein
MIVLPVGGFLDSGVVIPMLVGPASALATAPVEALPDEAAELVAAAALEVVAAADAFEVVLELLELPHAAIAPAVRTTHPAQTERCNNFLLMVSSPPISKWSVR